MCVEKKEERAAGRAGEEIGEGEASMRRNALTCGPHLLIPFSRAAKPNVAIHLHAGCQIGKTALPNYSRGCFAPFIKV